MRAFAAATRESVGRGIESLLTEAFKGENERAVRDYKMRGDLEDVLSALTNAILNTRTFFGEQLGKVSVFEHLNHSLWETARTLVCRYVFQSLADGTEQAELKRLLHLMTWKSIYPLGLKRDSPSPRMLVLTETPLA